ncbi:PTS sugar transporter subunit IIB [Clostridium sp. cel8]|jgi:sorbose PTS system EIIB component|uniref:PTS system mannose/fructose/N-acetylgalactosamine-transporter subunit IIB n=1 Tax=unclassified Clostridium TaxID=2614128 RepID=UPI0015F434A9|nr:PTS sugar transporter subunit IIB [Clostridium sp. cel8]MBA5851595.1 PTS sugar transporter subunit IIB [Clostridium sp. cel8]
MLNIVLTRIDDRLIHGQVATAWCKVTKANRIIVVDDEVAKDSFMEMVLKSAAPSSISVDVLSVKDAVNVINSDDTGEKVIILVKTPLTIVSLINSGVTIKELNLGGMGAKHGRKQLYKNISISEEERAAFKELIDKNVNIFLQIVPDAKQIDVSKLL